MSKSEVKIEFKTNITTSLVDFLSMLKGSLSLDLKAKFRILSVMSELSQSNIDELIAIFQQEDQRYKALSVDHPENIQLLQTLADRNWQRLCLKLQIPQIMNNH